MRTIACPRYSFETDKDRRINLRATSLQESLIRSAAERRGIGLTDFVLESTCSKSKAKEAIADQVHFCAVTRAMEGFH